MAHEARTPSSVTAATDDSPKCVGWNWGDAAAPDPGGIGVSASAKKSMPTTAGGAASPAPVGDCHPPSPTTAEDPSRAELALLRAAHAGGATSPEPETELCEGGRGGLEVELKDVIALLGRDGGRSHGTETEERAPSAHIKAKKILSRVAQGPTLKGLLSPRAGDRDRGDRAPATTCPCDQSVELSLLGGLDLDGGGDPVAGMLEPGGDAGADAGADAHADAGADAGAGADPGADPGAGADVPKEEARAAEVDKLAQDRLKEDPPNGTVSDHRATQSGHGPDERYGTHRKNGRRKIVPKLKSYTAFVKRLEVVDEAVGNEVGVEKLEEDEPDEDLPRKVRPCHSEVEELDSSPGSVDEAAGGRKNVTSRVRPNPELKHYVRAKMSNLNHEDDVEVSVSGSVCVNDGVATSDEATSRADASKTHAKSSHRSASLDVRIEKYVGTTKDCGSRGDGRANVNESAGAQLPSKSATLEVESGGKGGGGGMKQLMSRLKSAPKLKSLMSVLGGLIPQENAQAPQCITDEHAGERATNDVSTDSGIVVLEELRVLEANGDDTKVAHLDGVKDIENSSFLGMSVFSGTSKDSESILEKTAGKKQPEYSPFYNLGTVAASMTQGSHADPPNGRYTNTVEETPGEEGSAAEERNTFAEKPLEFREMEVTLKLKALTGVSQHASRRKLTSQNGEGADDTIKAVVTYRQNTIASDRFVSTHVPSLPICTETLDGQAHAQVYAQWPGGQEDDYTDASKNLPSSVTLRRVVRRVRHFDTASIVATLGGPQAKGPREEDQHLFLASLSKAFAPELVDLQIGIMRGSSEILPIGIATVAIPIGDGEFKRMELDIPVVCDYRTKESTRNKNNTRNKYTISQLRKKTTSSNDHFVFFSADKETKYKINEGAFLRLELNIKPTVTAHAVSCTPHHLNANNHKPDFRSGPINQALRRRRKMDHLLSLRKLPLHKRIQVYLELRSRKIKESNKLVPGSQEICTSRQTEVSELSFPRSTVTVEADEPSVDWAMDQYHTLGSSDGSEKSKIPEWNADTQNDQLLSHGASRDLTCTLASERPVSTKLANQTCKNPTSISLLLAEEQDGRQTPASHDSKQSDNLTHFSSSLHSVITTNHPQKPTLLQSMMSLLACERNDLVLCGKEKNVLKYDTQEQEDKIARCFAPYFHEEFSLQDTRADEDYTLASFESMSVICNRKR